MKSRLRIVKFYLKGSQARSVGPTDWFTGTVSVQPLFPQNEPSRMTVGHPIFSKARAPHTHPVCQDIIVISGKGRVERWGGPIEEPK